MSVTHFLLQLSSSQQRAILPPIGHLAVSGDIFDCYNWQVKDLPLIGVEVRMLLNILQCTGQLPITKNQPVRCINSSNTETLYFTCILSLKIRQCKSSNFVLFQSFFGYTRSFAFLYKFQNQFVNFYKSACWDFDWN